MKVKNCINKLKNFNPEAEIYCIVHNKKEEFSIAWGGNDEGTPKEKTAEVYFYVDNLCQSEKES